MLLAESWKAKASTMITTNYQIMEEKLPMERLNGWVLIKLVQVWQEEGSKLTSVWKWKFRLG